MTRNIKKTVEEFDKKHGKKDIFFATDLVNIKELSVARSESETLYNAILNALKAGYVLGYRKAQRDAKRKDQGEKNSK